MSVIYWQSELSFPWVYVNASELLTIMLLESRMIEASEFSCFCALELALIDCEIGTASPGSRESFDTSGSLAFCELRAVQGGAVALETSWSNLSTGADSDGPAILVRPFHVWPFEFEGTGTTLRTLSSRWGCGASSIKD